MLLSRTVRRIVKACLSNNRISCSEALMHDTVIDVSCYIFDDDNDEQWTGLYVLNKNLVICSSDIRKPFTTCDVCV